MWLSLCTHYYGDTTLLTPFRVTAFEEVCLVSLMLGSWPWRPHLSVWPNERAQRGLRVSQTSPGVTLSPVIPWPLSEPLTACALFLVQSHSSMPHALAHNEQLFLYFSRICSFTLVDLWLSLWHVSQPSGARIKSFCGPLFHARSLLVFPARPRWCQALSVVLRRFWGQIWDGSLAFLVFRVMPRSKYASGQGSTHQLAPRCATKGSPCPCFHSRLLYIACAVVEIWNHTHTSVGLYTLFIGL